MADYFTTTIIQPNIPSADITPLERLILSRAFSAEEDGDGVYFFAEIGIDETPAIACAALSDALGAADRPSRASDFVRAELDACTDRSGAIDLDLTKTSWERFFQDIIRRSPTLSHVTVLQAFTCSKMRPDGFGGAAILITADAIRAKSTGDLIEEFMTEAGRVEIVLAIPTAAVRETVAGIVEADADDGLIAADITDEDILVGRRAAQASFDRSEHEANAVFRAALAAVAHARAVRRLKERKAGFAWASG